MTPAARVQAAIELIDLVAAAADGGGAAADTIVSRYFATRRYAGSKDRRAVRDLVYAAIRRVAETPSGGRAAMLALLSDRPELADAFDGSAHGPAAIVPGEPVAAGGVAAPWLIERLAVAGLDESERAALIERAPLDIRVNTLLAETAAIAAALPGAIPLAGLPDGLRLPAGTDVAALAGRAEVQDAGSQLVSLAAGAAPGDRVVDLCAGAGGKTLALAAAMADRGTILAADTDRARLSRLGPRAAAAGVTIAEPRLIDPGREAAGLADQAGTADIVLIDAPCSGTGTWRRNPEARWRLTPDRLARLVAVQERLLIVAAALMRPGGTITYIVCSLLDDEGAAQIARFAAMHPDWRSEPPALARGRPHGGGWRLTPAHDDTDGFFVARLRAPC